MFKLLIETQIVAALFDSDPTADLHLASDGQDKLLSDGSTIGIDYIMPVTLSQLYSPPTHTPTPLL